MSEVLSYKTAGGVVINTRGEMLVLVRTVMRNNQPVNEIRLPKGHIDPGETDEEAGMREVGEESGYWDVEIISDLGEAHSSFCMDSVHYERNEHYFLMRLVDEKRRAPAPVSAEEALFEPQWVPVMEAPGLLTYATEQLFAHRAGEAINQAKTQG